ncbi:MAG: hypothetical protein ACK5G0_03720 [Bacteroidota bacterium]|jgi:hypothetical protein
MKKYLILFIAVFFSFSLKAQTSGAVVTTIPANFTALDQVKIIVDVSAVGNLAGRAPLYIWTWNPGDPAPGNGSWDNSNEARRMTPEGPNKWSWTITPAEYYNVAPGSVTKLQFLVKAKDGTGDKKTDDITLNVAPLVFTPTEFRSFPAAAGQNELLTIYFDQNLATDVPTSRMNPLQAEAKLFNTSGSQVGATKLFPLTALGNKLYSFACLPKTDFVIPAGTQINKMTVTYKGTLLNTNGAPINVSSVTFEKLFDDLK